jgi:hypothetical protein
MNAAIMFPLKPSEEIILAGAFRLVREFRLFSLGELREAVSAINWERFHSVLTVEEIPRLGCVEVRAGNGFIREFWLDEESIRYFPHRDDTPLATWLLHQLGHRIAEKLRAAIAFDDQVMQPFFHRIHPTPRDFIDHSPECAGLRNLWARLGASHELQAALAALPDGIRNSLTGC